MVKHGAPPSHLTAKTVAVAFVLAVLVFAGILLLPLLLESLPKDNTPAETDAPTGRVRQYALLFREAEGDLTGAVWLTADTRTCTMEAVGYPPQTEVAGDSGPATLSALFAADGSTAAAAALGDAVGGAPDGTLTFSVSGVAAFVNYLQNNLPYILPEPVGLLPAGAVTLTPMQTADLLRYSDWEGGAAGQGAAHAGVMAALFNRYLTDDRSLEADFSKLTALCDDRLSISQFAAVRDGLTALAAANDGGICTAVTAPGETVEQDGQIRYRLTAG